ncbi:MAG TPA: CocE/NonD family hydrolase [Blastocatellia bacterium]|nr:CocE/NonD family hydrolase [Blastocatellia bacterium]
MLVNKRRALALCLLIGVGIYIPSVPLSSHAQEAKPTRQEIKLDPKVFDAYAGQYELTPELIITISREGDKFFAEATGQQKVEIFAESETKFFLKIVDAQLTFVKDDKGKVTHLVLHQGGREQSARRITRDPETVPNVAFKKTDVMIPMRDGVKLHVVIFAPENATEPLPILMDRTPYGVDGRNSGGINFVYRELVKDGYIFVFADIRGRYKSEGEFVMNRPLRENRSDPKATDESTDTYDTIDWLVKNVPNNNGRVGVLGVSYDGWTTAMALIDPHPALKAASPQAAMGDTWMGDDFFHNGAFRLSYGFEYVAGMETTKDGYDFQHDRYDTYDWYLKLGPLSNANEKYFKGKLPTWNSFIEHPTYDRYWQRKSLPLNVGKPVVPTLNVAGWWDQEDFYGAMITYLAFEKNDAQKMNFLVVGPWNHGGWTTGSGDKLGKIQFDNDTGKYYREKIQAPFFAYYLKGKGTLDLAEATTFETGSNEWKSYEAWPPRQNYSARNLYFQSDGKLSFEAPAKDGDDQNDSYVSDPKHPVPYRNRPVQATYYSKGSDWYTWLTQDQRFVHNRPDVLSWETDVLAEDVTVSGQVIAHLFASTTGSDSDWIAKLIDVYPDDWPKDPRMGGYQLMIADEIFRGRYRQSFEKPEPLKPNQVYEYALDLRWADHTFRKGHRIMVQVQSTWFPVYDRNPQKYVENIFKAKESDYIAATQRVFRSKRFPSHVVLPVKTK